MDGEATVTKIYDINMKIEESVLNSIITTLEAKYLKAVTDNTVEEDVALWLLKDFLVLAKSNANN